MPAESPVTKIRAERNGGREIVMRPHRSVGSILGLAAVLVLSLAGTAAAIGPPEIETETFSDTFEDEFLTNACGVDVTTSFEGRLTFFTFPDQPVGPQDITSVHVNLVATAGDNAVQFKDVGVDLVRVEPDGTVVLMVVGQVPFEFIGVLMVNLETDEAILEPHHSFDTTRVCHLLTR
jgi:hypothetical protein